MTKEEKRILGFLADFNRICLEERDISQIEQMLDERISWVGVEKRDAEYGRDRVLELLFGNVHNSIVRYRILKEDYHIMGVSDEVFSFCGDLYMRWDSGDELGELELRSTGLCVTGGGAVRLLNIHYSFPGILVDGKNDFPKEDENTRVLRKLLGRQSKELEEKNQALQMTLERYRIAFNQTTDIMFEWDLMTDTMVYSTNWQKKFGYPPSREKVGDLIERSSRIHPDDKKVIAQMRRQMQSGVLYAENDIRIARDGGAYMWFQIHSNLQSDSSGRPIRVIGTLVDIDKQRKEREKLKVLAQQDSLTGLYNRGTIQTRIQRLVSRADKEGPCALLILDVDDFKMVNDTFGHLSGDMMLKDIAAELKRISPKDADIGRVGGDEFAVLLHHITGREQVREKADQILKSFKRLLPAGMEAISCSVGIAISPENGRDFATVYKAADQALYHAKRSGKNRYSFYQPSCPAGLSHASMARERAEEAQTSGMECCTLVNYVFEILNRGQNAKASLAQVLELVGKQLEVSRAYIFENNEDGNTFSNTYEWCNEGIKPQIGYLQNLEIFQYGSYYDNFDESGLFYCKDILALSHGSGDKNEDQSIKSILQCLIMDENEIKGFVGFDECSAVKYWTRDQINMLQMISKIAGIFLLKDRALRRLKGLEEGYRFVVGKEHHWFYVVEKDTYNLLYINDRMKTELQASGAGTCHEALFGNPSPCQECPMIFFDENRTCAAHGVWIEAVKRYLLAQITSLTWYDGRQVYMVDGSPVEKLPEEESVLK